MSSQVVSHSRAELAMSQYMGDEIENVDCCLAGKISNSVSADVKVPASYHLKIAVAPWSIQTATQFFALYSSFAWCLAVGAFLLSVRCAHTADAPSTRVTKHISACGQLLNDP